MKKNIEVIFKAAAKTEFKVIRVDLDRAEEMVWEAGDNAKAGSYLQAAEMKKLGIGPETLVTFDWASGAHGIR